MIRKIHLKPDNGSCKVLPVKREMQPEGLHLLVPKF